MTYRQFQFGSRIVRAIGDAVRGGLETIGLPGRSSGAETAVRNGGDGSVNRSPARRPVDDLVDPDTGPTNREEVLEYGCSPAAYVRTVLAEHDGRLKQRRFSDRYGWSSSTISRLLSDLEERGVIERYRVGHEKVVCLPDESPRAS